MDLVLLTETIVKKIVTNPDAVSVKEFESEEEDTILIQVMVDNSDMGKLIGSNGKIIEAIRTIVRASSFINNNKKVKINVDSF